MKKINFNRALVAKKKIFLFLLPALMLFAAGCKDKNLPEELPQTLSVNPELITCPDAGGDYTLTLTSPNGAWSATTNENWIRVTPTSGEKGTTEVRIKISPNKESAETKGEVTFTSGNETLKLPITRAAKAAPYLRIVSDLELNTPKEGGSYTVQIESNIKWSASSNTGWAKVNKGVSVNNDNITVTVSPATTPEETTATITIAPYGEGEAAGTQQVTITRGSTEATSLSVDPTEIKATENGGSFTVNVSSNAKWRVYKTWDMDWLTLSGSQEGDGNGSFSFSIEEATSMDAVSGILTIEEDRSDNYKPVVTQVAVSRKGKAAASLSVSPIAINAPAEGYEVPVEIKSNYPWTASLVGTKIFSVSTTSGDGDATMIVTVKPTTAEQEETGSITIRSSFGNEQVKINIRREAGSLLSLEKNQITAPAEGGRYYVKVKSYVSWTASSSDNNVAKAWQASADLLGVFVSPQSEAEVSSAVVTVSSEDGRAVRVLQVTRNGVPDNMWKPKAFTIGDDRRVMLAPGNLQYQASTNTWRFATCQYQYVGDEEGERSEGNVYYEGAKCNNSEISADYSGWIDLFGWGTGDNPTLHTTNSEDYMTWVSWGVNEIHYKDTYYQAGTWRLLNSTEWDYLLFRRQNAKVKHVKATVSGVFGIIFLPDEWEAPDGIVIDHQNEVVCNVFNANEWQLLERNGAIFLPAAESRTGADYYFGTDDEPMGTYWVYGNNSNDYKPTLNFRKYGLISFGSGNVSIGKSVRMAADIQ